MSLLEGHFAAEMQDFASRLRIFRGRPPATIWGKPYPLVAFPPAAILATDLAGLLNYGIYQSFGLLW